MRDKIKLLFLSANPGHLRSDKELRDIENRIRSASYGDAFEIFSAWATRPADVTGALLRHMPHIVHFSGHGRQERGIFLEDDDGRPLPVSADALCRQFEPLRGTAKVVILNACETRPLAEALRDLVDYTISMRKPITDYAAMAFVAGFYGALAHGQSVPSSFRLALGELDMCQIPETDIPDLLERPGLMHSELLPPKAAPEEPPSLPAVTWSQSISINNSQLHDVNNINTTKG